MPKKTPTHREQAPFSEKSLAKVIHPFYDWNIDHLKTGTARKT
jgi:hypothetical protein